MNTIFHFRSFCNFLSRNKLFTAINIFGFAVSLMFVILLGLYIQREYEVDSFHTNKDRIYRIEHSKGTWLSAALPTVLENRYPEIESITRLYSIAYTVEVPEVTTEKFSEHGFLVDSSFFTIFSYPFVEGSPQTALRTRDDVVLTQSFARKLFGDQPAMGRTIRCNGKTWLISGVLKDFTNSHLANPSILASMANAPDVFGEPNLLTTIAGDNDFTIYILAREGADIETKMAGLNDFFTKELQYFIFTDFGLKDAKINPLKQLYFSSITNDYLRTNDRTFLLVLVATALLILLFAVINYINLSVAQSGFRAQEAATRRLLGGSKGSLFAGFILESLIICFVSLCLGVLLAALVEPWFRGVMWTNISVADSFTAANMAVALGGVVVIGVISGLVPASVLTRFKPIDVVRGTFRRQTKMVYSKVLIAFQYCITIVLIGCTLTILKQVGFMQTSDLGFDKDFMIKASNPVNREREAGFRNQLMAIPGVEQVSFAAGVPMIGGYSGRYAFQDKDGQTIELASYFGDSTYMSILNFEVIKRTGVPDADAVWLNETAWRQLELPEDAVEYTNSMYHNFKIRGLVRDFHVYEFSQAMKGALIIPRENALDMPMRNLLLKVSPANPFATMERIREVYNQQAEGNRFDGRFFDQSIQSVYAKQNQTTRILGSLSLLAILISALGMLAMSTYFMRQRAQEVAVRKVFGATDREVLTRLVMSFLRLVVVAFVVAVPVIWYLMTGWLSGYVYRIPLSWTIFALAGGTAFVIAFGTVLWQSLKATRANPVTSLRD